MTHKKKENGLFDTSITRRDALKLMGTTAALAGASGMGLTENLFAQTTKGPNVLFILTDDHRWDILGAMGHPFIQTPNMDRLADEGVLFENAFVTTSLCSPSRASFLTGQYASVHGVVNNFSRWDPATNITYMQHFKEAGYATAFIGKWHMPGTGDGLPELPGVDLFVSFTRKDGQGDYWNCPIYKNYELVTEERNPYITTDMTDYAIDFVKEERTEPFCMYLSHKAVHHDWKPPEHLKGKYADADLSFLAPEGDKYNTMTGNNFLEGGMDDMHTRYRNYCECLESVDEEIGRLLAVLEETGQLDNTIIVYAGDNGYLFGEHRLIAKHYPYEESIRIPYIVRAPGIVNDPGRKADQMVLNLDLAPSLLELAGIPIPDSVQGESFAPILRSASAEGRESFVYELFRDFPFGGRVPPHKAVRTNTHKYIEWELCREPELYDLVNDPREMNNLIGTDEGNLLEPELAAELESLRQRFNLRPGMV